MPQTQPGRNSLVLYKKRPARVLDVTDKLEIELESGKTQRVRPKDVMLLHPGPLGSLAELPSRAGEVEDAWELLAGTTVQLPELAELVFGEHTPATSWAAWQLVEDGLYFHGIPDEVVARPPDELQRERAARAAKLAEEQAWADFIGRLRKGKALAEDAERLREVEGVALGSRTRSRILHALGRQETRESAHALLLRLGHWENTRNPHPRRLQVPDAPPVLPVPALAEEERQDLTGLAAFAIDDEDNQDPDDAISLDGDRLWVHVADVGGLIRPDDDLDLEARARSTNLYLPEQTTPMLPPAVTERLGLGLHETSPALSFGLTLGSEGEITHVEVVASRVRVRRLSYREADERLHAAPFADLVDITRRFRERRTARGAALIDLPEVKVRVAQGEVRIDPLPRIESRQMVTDAMLMAGEAAARFALDLDIAFPFATQPPPDVVETPQGMAAMFAHRKRFKRSQMKVAPEPHAGLGLEVYAQATSPLRRYLDLVVHQQLRAFLRGERPLNAEEVLARVGSTEAMTGNMRAAERLSNRHWTLVYLLQNPDWEGEGVLVEKRGPRGTVIIPALGLDARIPLSGDPPLDTVFPLRCTGVNLPELVASFRTTDPG